MLRNNKEIKKIVIKNQEDEVLAVITDYNITRRGDIEVFIDDKKN